MGNISFLGLSSGTDWNSVIEQLVQIERRPIDKLSEQRARLAFEQSVMGRVNTQLGALSTQLSNLRFESTFLSRLVESSSPARLSATAEAGAPTGTHIIEVQRLAQAARAASGLDGELFSKVANLSPTQTMGIASLTPFGDFQPTRALATTLIKDTIQAGRNGAAITAGDSISISGQLKDGSAVSGSFTFSGGASDTLQRLATTIAQVFHGEIAASVGSNGELTFIETDPSVAGDVGLNMTLPPIALSFNDNDYSGSTLAFGYGNNVAGAGATTRRLVNSVTFTTAGAIELNPAADLALLDQVSSGSLNVGDKIRIAGTEANGTAISTVDFTYTGAAGGQSIADLLTAITGAYASANATYENGKIVLTGTSSGASSLSLQLSFIDTGAATGFELGSLTVAESGRAARAQMVTTGSFTVEGGGEHLLRSTDGRAGRLRGNTTLLDPSNSLSSYGVTEFDLLTIDVDAAGGGLGPRTITGLSEYSTLQDLIDAVNGQVPAVTAQLSASSGTYRLELIANDGGRDIRAYDVAGGILDKLFSAGATDVDSSSNNGTTTFSATTVNTDFTMVDWFTPANGGPAQRRVVTGAEGGPVVDLIGGVAINGNAGSFLRGVATVTTADSAELNTRQQTRSYLFGSASIAASPPQGIPFINTTAPLAEAGFATTPENSSDNPLFHTDGFFTVNGVRVTVGDVTTTSLDQVLAAINSSGAGVTAFFDSAASRIVMRSNAFGPQAIALGGGGDTSNFLQIAGLLPAGGGVFILGQEKGGLDTALPLAQAGFTQPVSSGVFTINGTRISVDAGVDSLADLLRKITNSGAGVTAAYDAVADNIILTQKLDSSSTSPYISVGDAADTSNFLEAAGLTADTTSARQIGSARQTALFTVDGMSYERSSNTVADVLEKVKITLNSVTAGPETLTISGDTQRTEDAIVDFLSTYNATMELLNAKPLTREERQLTAELTDEKANSMTVDEINAYLVRRQDLQTRDFVSSDNSIRQLTRQIQNLIGGPVINSGSFQSLSQLGLSTSQLGGGAEAASASLGRLLVPTSDKETLRQFVQSNSDLQAAIANQSSDLYELFAGLLDSRFTHTGTRSLAAGFSVSSGLRFQIGDGKSSVTVQFAAGTYSQSSILNRVNQALSSGGLAGSVLAFYDALNQLNIRSASSTTQARLSLLDLSSGGDSLLGLTGLTPGLFFGPDPAVAGGVARRTREALLSSTGVGGTVFERIKENGSFDRQITAYDKQLARMERSVSAYEARLRSKFARLETTLSQLQAQSAKLTSAIASLQAQTNQGS